MRLSTLMNYLVQAAAVICMVCLGSQTATGQCTPRWLYSSDHVIPGISQDALGNGGIVRAMVAWDPDGDGPIGQWLVFAGEFTRAGSLTTTNIAAWDGSTWHPLGTGTNTGGSVYALEVWNGQLVAGGNFSTMNGVTVSNIAKYDGTTWSRFNTGTAPDTNGAGRVHAMTVYRNELIIGGTFTQIGQGNVSNVINRIARWTGTSWQTVGTGVTAGSVFALTTFGDDLIVGGSFTGAGGVTASKIARWNRDSGLWSSMNSGTNGDVLALQVFNTQLIVGGVFTAVSGSAIPAGRVASWTLAGGWNAMGSGFNGDVLTLEVHNNELHAGGQFTAGFTDTTARLGVARWNGTTWSQRNEGIMDGGPVESLYSWNNQLFIGGGFYFDGNRNLCRGFGVLDEQTYGWVPVSNSFQHIITSMVEYKGHLYTNGLISNAQNGPASGFARWNGQVWESPTTANMSTVNGMFVFQDELIVTGLFTLSNGGPGDRIAAWNGTSWRPLGAGFNNSARAFAVYQGSLIAAGTFTSSGTTTLNCIAKWNGSSWEPLGSGMSNPISGTLAVQSLAIYNNELIAAGHFTRAGGVTVNHIAKWNGTNWASVGGGFTGTSFTTVLDMKVYNNELYVTGNAVWFSPTLSGTGNLNDIGRWNGTNWRPAGTGLSGESPNGSVGGFSLAVHDGFLYAGGLFRTAGGVANTSHVARWNGTAWSSLGVGIEDFGYTSVRVVYPYNGELLAAGHFSAAGGQPSGFFARWTNTNIPWAGPLDPTDQHLCEGQFAQFDVIPASGYTTTITWQQETAPNSGTYITLTDGPAPGAPSTILSGTTSTTLTISNVTSPLNALRYRAIIANACGQDIHNAGQLTVTSHPVIDTQPASLTACLGDPVEFSVSVADPNATYQWRFQGVDISPELNPFAATATLMLASTVIEDAGTYDCIVTNACDFTSITESASLSFCACLSCGADFNQDGGIDGSDVSDFFLAWESGSCDADVNNDGGIDGSDVNDFFVAWEAGGC